MGCSNLGTASRLRVKHWTGNYHVRCSSVAGSWNIVQDCQSENSFNVNIMRLRLQWIPKENQNIQLLISNHSPKLHVSTIRTALQQIYLQSRFLNYPLTSASCRVKAKTS